MLINEHQRLFERGGMVNLIAFLGQHQRENVSNIGVGLHDQKRALCGSQSAHLDPFPGDRTGNEMSEASIAPLNTRDKASLVIPRWGHA